MAKTARILGCALAALVLMTGPAAGQRVQFPSAIAPGQAPPATVMSPTLPAGTVMPGAVAPNGAIPGLMPGTNPPGATFAPSPGTSQFLSPAPLTAPSAVITPTPGPYPGPIVTPGPAPGLYSGPATFDGSIQAPPASWDPYATPGGTPATLFPTDPYLQGAGPFAACPPATKLLQDIRLTYGWLAPIGSNFFSTNDFDLNATFAFPFFYNQQTPLLVTPGFGLHLWDGPDTTVSGVDLPPRVYDAYLDAAWNPQLVPWLGAELGARVGVFSDFTKITGKSVRVQARALADLAFSPAFQIKAGVIFLDRNHIKWLPAGGVVWTPNADCRFDILFPNPRLAHRWTTLGTCEWWYYVRGEYPGGGTWTVRRASPAPAGSPPPPNRAGQLDSVDYNDIRVALGLEFIRTSSLHGFFEVGTAFDREILFFPVTDSGIAEPVSKFRPSTTVFLGAGVAF